VEGGAVEPAAAFHPPRHAHLIYRATRRRRPYPSLLSLTQRADETRHAHLIHRATRRRGWLVGRRAVVPARERHAPRAPHPSRHLPPRMASRVAARAGSGATAAAVAAGPGWGVGREVEGEAWMMGCGRCWGWRRGTALQLHHMPRGLLLLPRRSLPYHQLHRPPPLPSGLLLPRGHLLVFRISLPGRHRRAQCLRLLAGCSLSLLPSRLFLCDGRPHIPDRSVRCGLLLRWWRDTRRAAGRHHR